MGGGGRCGSGSLSELSDDESEEEDDEDDGGDGVEEDVEPVLDDPGEDVVAHVHVLGEAVDDPAERRRVEVRHR